MQIERVVPVAGNAQKQEFAYVLSKQAYHSVSEGHLWFSIFSRPPSTQFTCVQRCTCCFVLLLTSMLLNILYYDQATEAKGSQASSGLAVGPLFITPQQVCLNFHTGKGHHSFHLYAPDRNRCDRGDALVSAQHPACAVLPSHPASPRPATAITIATSNLSGEGTDHAARDEEAIDRHISMVVPLHRVRCVNADGRGVDLLHHCPRH